MFRPTWKNNQKIHLETPATEMNCVQLKNLKFSRGPTRMTFVQLKNLKFSRGPTEMNCVQLKNLKFFRGQTERTCGRLKNFKFSRGLTFSDLRVNWKNWNFLAGQLKWPPGQLKKLERNSRCNWNKKLKMTWNFLAAKLKLLWVNCQLATDVYHKQCIINQIGVLI